MFPLFVQQHHSRPQPQHISILLCPLARRLRSGALDFTCARLERLCYHQTFAPLARNQWRLISVRQSMIVEVFTDRFMFSSPVRSDPQPHLHRHHSNKNLWYFLTACSNDFAQRIERQSNFGSQEIHPCSSRSC